MSLFSLIALKLVLNGMPIPFRSPIWTQIHWQIYARVSTNKIRRNLLGIVCKPGCSGRLVSIQMAIKHVETEAAHLRRDNHLPASTSRTRSRAEIRGEASWVVASWCRGQCVGATTTTSRTSQAVHSVHVPRRNSRRGTNPQVRSTMSGPCQPVSSPHPARTPRPGGSRQLLLLHPAAPGRHLGTICTDTPLPTHHRHRGEGGGERRPDVEIPLR